MQNNKTIFNVGMTNDNQITITTQSNPEQPVFLDIHNAEHLTSKLQMCIDILEEDKNKEEDMVF